MRFLLPLLLTSACNRFVPAGPSPSELPAPFTGVAFDLAAAEVKGVEDGHTLTLHAAGRPLACEPLLIATRNALEADGWIHLNRPRIPKAGVPRREKDRQRLDILASAGEGDVNLTAKLRPADD